MAATRTTRWETESASARCYSCAWRKHGKQGTVVAAAREHVELTGHPRIEVSRSQWRFTERDA
jgi:hypothetical protein